MQLQRVEVIKNKKNKYNFIFDYAILNHGATIIDKNENILWNKSISNKIIPEIKTNLDKSNYISYFCCSTLESRVDFNHSNLAKIAVTFDNKEKALKKAEELNRLFKNDIKAFYVNKNSVEIISNKTSKEQAIQYLAKINHIDKSEIYTIGDGYSDINMIKAFQGYGMEQSVGEVKINAKKVYNSVSLLIEELFLFSNALCYKSRNYFYNKFHSYHFILWLSYVFWLFILCKIFEVYSNRFCWFIRKFRFIFSIYN